MKEFLEIMSEAALDGFKPIARSAKAQAQNMKMSRLVEGKDPNTGDRLPAHVWEYLFKEAMTTSNFPYIFGDTLQRELQARYAIARPNMRRICKVRANIRDFRPVKVFRVDGMTGPLQVVEEKGEYLADTMTESKISYALKKFGRQVDFSWEAYLNDDLGIFGDVAARLADACVNTEERLITSIFWNAGGPIDASFSIATSVLPLSITALETAITALNSQTLLTSTGLIPLNARPRYLVVPPALEVTARKILDSPVVLYAATAAAATPLPSINTVSQYGIELIKNEWIPIINTTTPTSSWALFCDPADLPACELGLRAGSSEPELWMKAPDAVRVGGGAVSQFDGDFATDNIFYRVRHCMNACLSSDLAGYASTGAGQ